VSSQVYFSFFLLVIHRMVSMPANTLHISVSATMDVTPSGGTTSTAPPLPELTTTEAVVRMLKSTGYTYDERLRVALWLWDDQTLIFPQRREFLLSWCTSAMLRFAGKKEAR
jgi:hypothetical protein